MLTKPIRKLGLALGMKWLLGWIRAAAEGRKGDRLKAWYWKFEGWKTASGFALATLALGLALLSSTGRVDIPPAAQAFIGIFAGFVVQAGLLDKAWRSARPDAIDRNPVVAWLAEHPADVAAAFGAAFTWQALDCAFGGLCTAILWALSILAGAAIQFGLLDAAWRAPEPRR